MRLVKVVTDNGIWMGSRSTKVCNDRIATVLAHIHDDDRPAIGCMLEIREELRPGNLRILSSASRMSEVRRVN